MTSLSAERLGSTSTAPRPKLKPERPRVLIVEPEDGERSLMKAALEEAGYEVRAEPDGTRIERAVREFAPHLAVLNVWFEVPPCGYTMTRRLRRTSDLPALLVLRREDGVDMRVFGMEAGADQLIFRPFSPAELVARVRAMLRRSGDPGSTTVDVGDLALDEASRTATRRGVPLVLTEREFDLLLALARNPGRVLSKQRLSTLVSGPGPWGTSTLATQVSGLRRKLEAHGPRLIHTAHGVGYVLKARNEA